MEQIDKDNWVETVSDSPILAKLVLRKYMKAQSARRYTQILDEFFILKADNYDGMPEIKIVLEDWLDYVAHMPSEIRGYIDDLFKFVKVAEQQVFMSNFMESLHKNKYTRSTFSKNFSAASFLKASEYGIIKSKEFGVFLEPIDEFRLVSFSVNESLSATQLYFVNITLENHYTMTKEHLNALMSNLEEDKVIDGTWTVNID